MNTVDHVLKNTRAVLDSTFSAGAADGTVTVTVANANGVTVSSGPATTVSGGEYQYALAPQPQVASLTVTWSGSWGGVAQQFESYVEIVGAYLFTIAQARAFDDDALADIAKYPDADIREVRAGITDDFEQIARVSFVPRYGRELVDASPDGTLWIRRKGVTKLLSVSIDGTALTSDELADVALYPGRLYRVPSLGWRATKARGVVVEYEHGHKSPPYAIHQAALIYARSILVTSDLSDRTIVFTNELGTVRNAVAGRDYPTGIPAVDAALYRYGERTLLR